MTLITSTSNLTVEKLQEDTSLGHFLYGLLAAFPLLLLPSLFSLLINMLQREAGMGDVLKSHLGWQRRSMFGLLAVLLLGYSLTVTWASMTLYLLGTVWFTARLFKGWLSLLEGRSI
ncbi:hypothetical protein [Shewanella surugensis]|uniref:DUF4870 domain-containing protein n=1 Tax=Shewanella surugensis TaxID=212020 RepID=A0ABT0L5W0_9GAMM|nr:hypothetical protein [Shewanella surugensis]MCL1123076.1 hypothetical protein [Shewanella surugensis]